VKNFAYLVGKPRQPKSDGLQNDLANTPAMKSKPPRPKDSRRQTKHDLKKRETQNRKVEQTQSPARPIQILNFK
jgi:hypothetical protein